MSLKEYLDTFWPFNMVLHELLDSLKEAILEEDLEEPNQGAATSKKGHGVTGYQEVS
jgi:DIS3-like exonuclease 1